MPFYDFFPCTFIYLSICFYIVVCTAIYTYFIGYFCTKKDPRGASYFGIYFLKQA